jgi:hypothetical protein
LLGHPGQGQAGFGQRLPERRFPTAFGVVVDGLRVGEIRKYLFRGFDDDILNFRHGVSLFSEPAQPARLFASGYFAKSWCTIFLQRMMRKSHSHDKAAVRGAACKGDMQQGAPIPHSGVMGFPGISRRDMVERPAAEKLLKSM